MSNLTKALTPYYADHIVKIRTAHVILAKFSDIEVEKLWETFSRERGASYLGPYDEILLEFTEWLES